MATMHAPRRPALIGPPGHRDRVAVVAVMLAAVVAWMVLALSPTHPMSGSDSMVGPMTSHASHHHGDTAMTMAPMWQPTLGRLAGWTVMVVAMMLPPALPLVLALRQVTSRLGRGRWTVLGTASFVGAWVAAGAVLIGVDAALSVSPASTLLDHHPQIVAGAAALFAGGYQFTPLKRSCLTACRSPRQLVLTRWRGSHPAADVTRIGAQYGVVCVGCCWALMLLMLAVGWPALPVMVVMSAAMAAERLLPRARMLMTVLAIASIVLGVLLLAGIVPAAHIIGG